jgi:lipoprotein-anchoring transpeptidase ErfK/SrfK
VFKSRRPTGEVLKPNAPGRDPIVSRILWLSGTNPYNRNTYRRYIYIHGTPEVNRLGTPASYGCIRMGTRDVVDLYNRVGTGADVYVMRGSLPRSLAPKSNSIVAR